MTRDWHPNPGPQERFLRSSAFEVLYGGAAGGGKTDGLLVEALRQIDNPHYRGIIFRRTFPQLERSGGLIDRSQSLYPFVGGEYSLGKYRWTFPSGAVIGFAHMQRESDRYDHQGAQYAFVAFDELTHFTESQYLYLFSRCRTTLETGLRCYVRAASNPGGVGHEWVKRRWRAWLDKEYRISNDAPNTGEVQHYAMVDGQDTLVHRKNANAQSRTFIPAKVSDNPYLAGTDYERNLMALPLVERKRLLDGDWDIMPGRGTVLRREWFEIVDAAPVQAKRARFWDLAATTKERQGDDPDYTVGARVSRTDDGIYYIEHLVRGRKRWHDIKSIMRQTASADGIAVKVGIEQEPGSSGKALIAEIVKHLDGFSSKGYPARGDKIVRAGPWAAQAEGGNVKLVKGPWNSAFLDECEWFPEGAHDDQVDAVSGAFAMLAKRRGHVSAIELPY